MNSVTDRLEWCIDMCGFVGTNIFPGHEYKKVHGQRAHNLHNGHNNDVIFQGNIQSVDRIIISPTNKL